MSASWPSAQILLKLADKTYLDFYTTDKWVSVDKKARQSAFLITSESLLKQVFGIVAGKDTHFLTVKLNAMLELSRKLDRSSEKKLKNKQKKNNNKRLDHPQNKGKLAPPTRNESFEHIIYVKPMFWLRRE